MTVAGHQGVGWDKLAREICYPNHLTASAGPPALPVGRLAANASRKTGLSAKLVPPYILA